MFCCFRFVKADFLIFAQPRQCGFRSLLFKTTCVQSRTFPLVCISVHVIMLFFFVASVGLNLSVECKHQCSGVRPEEKLPCFFRLGASFFDRHVSLFCFSFSLPPSFSSPFPSSTTLPNFYACNNRASQRSYRPTVGDFFPLLCWCTPTVPTHPSPSPCFTCDYSRLVL